MAVLLTVLVLAIASPVHVQAAGPVDDGHLFVAIRDGGPPLSISQSVSAFGDRNGPFMSVYRVDAYLDGEIVYSNVYGIMTEDADGDVLDIDDGAIPDGAETEVTLLYSGPSYSLAEGSSLVVDATGGTAAFELAYDPSGRAGYGIVNRFVRGTDIDTDGFVLPSTGGGGSGLIFLAGLALAACGLAGTRSARRRRVALVLAACLLASTASPAYASPVYGPPLTTLGIRCDLVEQVDEEDLSVKLAVACHEYSASCFVRVRAFCPSGYSLEWTVPDGWSAQYDEEWTPEGWVLVPDCWYGPTGANLGALRTGCATSDVTDGIDDDLELHVLDADGNEVGPGPYDFNVVVVLEYERAVY